MRTNIKNSILILILMFTSCGIKDEKFNSYTWKNMVGDNFSDREPLVNDLIKNHMHKGMSYHEIIQLLGNPEIFGESEKNNITYILQIEYDLIDPVRGKDLIINLTKDSTISEYKVIEWKK